MTTEKLIERCSKLTPEQLKPIRLDNGVFIKKPHIFVNHHIERLSGHPKSIKPYADRLEKFLNLVNCV